jgi:uncharacterized ferredoxin-like protein
MLSNRIAVEVKLVAHPVGIVSMNVIVGIPLSSLVLNITSKSESRYTVSDTSFPTLQNSIKVT